MRMHEEYRPEITGRFYREEVPRQEWHNHDKARLHDLAWNCKITDADIRAQPRCGVKTTDEILAFAEYYKIKLEMIFEGCDG
jgi:hypothetical protein